MNIIFSSLFNFGRVFMVLSPVALFFAYFGFKEISPLLGKVYFFIGTVPITIYFMWSLFHDFTSGRKSKLLFLGMIITSIVSAAIIADIVPSFRPFQRVIEEIRHY